MLKVMSVFGTRPEAIKMCPLVKKLEEEESIESIVCLTGQHREMLQQVIDIFGTTVHYNLDIMRPRQTLTTIATSVLEKMESVLEKEQPDIVLVAMGVPKQEMWIHEHLKDFPGCVAIGVGGLLDFVSERIPRAPMWMRKSNIEWCYRLYNEPIRLFKRYIIGNPLFILRVYSCKIWRKK